MKKVCNIYIGLWCLYELQGTLYAMGGMLSKTLLLILIIMSIYFFIYAISKFQLPKVLRILSVIVIVFSIYGIFNILNGNGFEDVPSSQYLKHILMSLLPIFTFYVFGRQGLLTESSIRWWFFAFLICGIVIFYRTYQERLLAAMELGSTRTEFTNNSGYIMLSLITLVPLFNKKPLIQYLLLGVCVAFVLMGMKRGAILIATISVLWLLYMMIKKNYNGSKRGVRIIITFLLVVGAVYGVKYFLLESDYFNTRIEQTLSGDSSGRDDLYGQFIQYLLNDQTVFSFLFGAGADGTLRIVHEYAHNDWLEIAVNNGVLVLLLYLWYWMSFYITIRKFRGEGVIHQILVLFFIIYFMMTFFSMSYEAIPFFASCALGYALSQTHKFSSVNIKI